MRGLGKILLALLPFSAALTTDLQNDLRDVPEESLRIALEKALAPKYKDGVFEHEGSALEAIHAENPQLASRVLESAKQDLLQKLLRRQANNTTAITTTSLAVVSITTTPATVIVDSTTTTPAGQTSTYCRQHRKRTADTF